MVHGAVCLRAYYAMLGTEIAYGAIGLLRDARHPVDLMDREDREVGSYAYHTPCPVLAQRVVLKKGLLLVLCYAMPGTGIAYAATGTDVARAATGTEIGYAAMLLPGCVPQSWHQVPTPPPLPFFSPASENRWKAVGPVIPFLRGGIKLLYPWYPLRRVRGWAGAGGGRPA
eukprot:1149530-Rhodomonas_salina.2